MDKYKSPQELDCNYADLCCFSPIIPFTGFDFDTGGLPIIWAGQEPEITTADVPSTELAASSQQRKQYSNQVEIFTNMRIEKSHWVCDYSDDIFQTLRETELQRYVVNNQSGQCSFRPALLRLMKVATEVHKLARTTLHLAVYLLDGFMDNYTIRSEKLNLTALTCLIIAAKIEETDVNAPKFADLNNLVGNVYTLGDFRQVEIKILMFFRFNLIRPTAATFAEYFANNIITLDDYHAYMHRWYGGIYDYYTFLQQQQHQTAETVTSAASAETFAPIIPPFYRTYEEMAMALSKQLFNLVDECLSYIKLANVRPSIIAAACIAAVRQLSFVTPIWTPYLVKITEYTQEMIASLMETIIALHNLHLSKAQAILFNMAKPTNTGGTLCDSPESGFVSLCDTKSESSDDDEEAEDGGKDSDYEDDDVAFAQSKCAVVLGKRRRSSTCNNNDDSGDANEGQRITSCSNTEYSFAKRKRMAATYDNVDSI